MLAFFQSVATAETLSVVDSVGPTGIGAILLFVFNRITAPIVRAANKVSDNMDSASRHREQEAEHWAREERLLGKIAGLHVLESSDQVAH